MWTVPEIANELVIKSSEIQKMIDLLNSSSFTDKQMREYAEKVMFGLGGGVIVGGLFLTTAVIFQEVAPKTYYGIMDPISKKIEKAYYRVCDALLNKRDKS